jgi:CHAT domain-containing protein/Tfp pilus assembly protein PilF
MPRALQDRDSHFVVRPRKRGAARLLATISVALMLVCLSACTHRDPEIAYQQAIRAYRQGNLAAAANQAEKGYKQFHKASADWAWKFTTLKARVLSWRGMNDEVLKLLASEPEPPLSGDLAVQRYRLDAVAYALSLRFAESERELKKAESICASSPYPSCGDLPTARGVLQMETSQHERAEESFERALASARAGRDQFLEATALLNLSWCAERQEHYDDALGRANAARDIAIPQGFEDVAQTALGNMGWAYYKLGDAERAKETFIEAKKQAEKLADFTDQVTWLQAIGYVDLDANRLDAARQSFQQSFDLAKHTNREDTIDSLTALAFVSELTGKLDEAKRYDDEALSMARADNDWDDLVYPLLVKGRLALRLSDFTNAESTFREVVESHDSDVFLKWEAERSLARLYENERQFDRANREYKTALGTFETARSELKHEDSRLPFLTNASRIYDDYIHFLVTRDKKGEALQVADFSRARTLAEGLGLLQKETSFKPAALDAQGVARRAGATILFYWLGEKQSYLWAITPQKTVLFDLPPGSEIDAAAQRYRQDLGGSRDVLESADGDGQYLYRTLIAPAQSLLKKDSKVLIIPDGSLNNLNFETLLVPEPKLPASNPTEPKLHYWIEDVTIADASSLRILGAASTAKQKRDRSLLLVGDSVAPSDKYPQLAQAGAQMESVARHFPTAGEKILTRKGATPSAYLASNPERFSYIHFVAHGTASRLSPLDSAIVLSKDSAEDDSFKLYARDIIHHPLRAELVTVSACYSAGERSYTGEGLVGLSWAFLRAGAHNVIAALWDATDAPTEQLMDKFYDELNQGAAPDTALRAAKLSLLHHSAFHNPYYWAPFQLYARLG